MRGYAQKQPMQEYKRESFEMFSRLMSNIQHEVIRVLSRVQVRAEEDVQAVDAQRQSDSQMQFQHEEARSATAGSGPVQSEGGVPQDQPYIRSGRKVGRNEPCPCGSGEKFKRCHGKLQ